MSFSRIPTNEPLFKLDENRELRSYVEEEREGQHEELMKVVRESIHPPKKGGNWWSSLKNAAWNVVTAPAKGAEMLARIPGAVSAIKGPAALYEAAKEKAINFAKETPLRERERHLNATYMQKRTWIRELRVQARAENDETMLNKLDRLQQLLESDRSRAIEAILFRLVEIANIKPESGSHDRVIPFEVMVHIEDAIKLGDLAVAVSRINDALESNVDEEAISKELADEARIHLRDLARLVGQAENPVDQMAEKVLALDLQQLIEKSPLPAFYALHTALVENPQNEAWRAKIDLLRKAIQSDENAGSLKLLREIETKAAAQDFDEAEQLVNEMISGLIHSLIDVAKECVTLDRRELCRTILDEDFHGENSEDVESIRGHVRNKENAEASEEIARLAGRVRLKDEEQLYLQALGKHLEMGTAQLLLQAVNVVRQGESTGTGVQRAADELRDQLRAEVQKKQNAVIASIQEDVRRDGDLSNVTAELRSLESKGKAEDAALQSVIERAGPRLQERLGQFKVAYLAEEDSAERYKLIAELDREANRTDTTERLDSFKAQVESEVKGTYGTLLGAMHEISTAEGTEIPKILSRVLKEVLEKEGKGQLKAQIDRFRNEAGAQLKKEQIEELKRFLPRELHTVIDSVLSHVQDREDIARSKLEAEIAKGGENKETLEKMLAVLNNPEHTLWTDVLDMFSGIVGGEHRSAEESFATMSKRMVREEGAKALIDALDRKIEALKAQPPSPVEDGKKPQDPAAEIMMLEMLKGVVGNAQTNFDQSFKDMVQQLAVDQIKPYSLKQLEEFKAGIHTAQDQAKELRRRIDEAGEKIGPTAKEGLENVVALLAKDQRAPAMDAMEEVMRAVWWEKPNPEQQELLEGFKRYVAVDTRLVSEHFAECMAAVIDGDGKNVQEPLMKMLTAVAKQQGPEILRDQVAEIRKGAAYQAKATAINEMVDANRVEYRDYRGALDGVQEALRKGNLEAAKRRGKGVPGVLDILNRNESGLSIAIIDTLDAALSGANTDKATAQVYDEMREQMQGVMEEGKKELVSQLDQRLQELQRKQKESGVEGDTMQTLTIKMLKGIVENSQEDVDKPMQEMLKDLARGELKPYLLAQLEGFQEQLDTPQAQAATLLEMMESGRDFFSAATYEKLERVHTALNLGERAAAEEMMKGVMDDVLFEDLGVEQQAILEQMQKVVEQDDRLISQHLSAALAGIIANDARNVQQPIIDMVGTIAKKQGPGMLRSQMELVRARLAQQGAAGELDKLIREHGPLMADDKKRVLSIRLALLEGRREDAERFADGLPNEDLYLPIRKLVKEEQSSLSLALIDSLCASLTPGADMKKANDALLSEFKKQADEWRKTGQQKMLESMKESVAEAAKELEKEAAEIKRLDEAEEPLSEADQKKKDHFDALLLKKQGMEAIIAGFDEKQDMSKPLKALFKTLAEKEGKPWALKQIAETRKGAKAPTLEPNLAAFRGYFEVPKHQPSETIRRARREIEAALRENDRATARRLLDEVENAVLFTPATTPNQAEANARDRHILIDLKLIVDKDHSGLTMHTLDALENILQNNGQALSNDLTQLVTVVAQNEGRDVLIKQVDQLCVDAEKRSKATAIEKFVLSSHMNLSDYKDVILQIRDLAAQGKYAEAKRLLPRLARNKEAQDAIQRILDRPQAELQTSLLTAFREIITGHDPKEPLMAALQVARDESDRMLFQKFADRLTAEDPHGLVLEQMFKEFSEESEDQGSVPANLKRIFQYFVSPQGREAVGNVAARRLYERVMGEEVPADAPMEINQQQFNQKMTAMIDGFFRKPSAEGAVEDQLAGELPQLARAFSNWLIEGKGLEHVVDTQVLGPLLTKIDDPAGAGLEGLLTEWLNAENPLDPNFARLNREKLLDRFTNAEGRRVLYTVLARRYAMGVNEGAEVPTRASLELRRDELTERLEQMGTGADRLCQAAIAMTIKQIRENAPSELKDSQVVLDVGEFAMTVGERDPEGRSQIYFADAGSLVVGMDEEDFKLSLEVAIKQGLVEGRRVLGDAARGENGYGFVCDLAAGACRAVRRHLNEPDEETKWDDEKATQEMVQKLFGDGMQTLGFTPFVRQVIGELIAPSGAAAIPFRVMGVQPIGPQIVENLHKNAPYKSLFDDVLARDMEDKIKELSAEGNLYDYVMKHRKDKTEKLELSEQEKKLHKQLGKLALVLYKKIDPESFALVKGLGFGEKFEAAVGDVMIPVLRETLGNELGKSHDQITVDDMYNYALQRGGDSLQGIVDEVAPDPDRKGKAIKNLSRLAEFYEPMKKHKSLAGLIFGGVLHFIAKYTIQPLIRLIGAIVRHGKTPQEYRKTIWYRLTEGVKRAKFEVKAETELYNPLRDIVRDDRLWKRVYQRVLRERVLS